MASFTLILFCSKSILFYNYKTNINQLSFIIQGMKQLHQIPNQDTMYMTSLFEGYFTNNITIISSNFISI